METPKFKRVDYTKKELVSMPYIVKKLYDDFVQGKQSYPYVLKEASIKHPEYFEQ